MSELVKLQLCTAVIDVPAEKAGEWEAKGWKRVEKKGAFVPPPQPLETGKAVEE
jgi:hypothetical protein